MTAALVRLVSAETRVLRVGERVQVAGRARTVRGTESAQMFPPNSIWVLTDQRLLVFAGGERRGGPQLGRPLVDLALGSVVTAARLEPFDDRDVLLVVQAGDHPAMVLMQPGDASAIVEGIQGAVEVGDEDADDRPSVRMESSPLRSIDVLAGGDAEHGDGDERVVALRAALAEGAWESARSLFVEQHDAMTREYLVGRVGGDELVDGIDTWIANDPDSATAYLLRGANGLESAAVRRANGGTEEALWADLRAAERDLFWALELDFDDPAPFTPLIRSGLALGVPIEELCMRYDESIRRGGDLLGVHLETLLALGPLGRGSDAEMFTFARSVARAAPEGSPLHCLVPMAHLIASLPSESSPQRRHYFSGEPTSEIDFFAMMSVDSDHWEVDVVQAEAVNVFAAAIARCGDLQRAAALLERNRAHRTVRPWNLLDGGDELYRSVVAAST